MPEDSCAGLSIWSTRTGQGERPALAIHCSLATSRSLRPLSERLGDLLTVTAFDLPGHGRSGPWTGEGDYVEAAVDLAESFCDGPTDLIGHSLGGVVALSLMARRPDLVRSATLIEPVLFAAARQSEAYQRYRSTHDPIMEAIAQGRREWATAAFTGIWGAGQPWDELPAHLRQGMVDQIDLVAAAGPGLHDDSTGILTGNRLAQVTAPVLLLRGGQTPPVIVAINDALEALLPNVRQAVIAGAGHMLPITHADAVAAETRRMLLAS